MKMICLLFRTLPYSPDVITACNRDMLPVHSFQRREKETLDQSPKQPQLSFCVPPISDVFPLPLSLLASQESLEDLNNLLQSIKISLKILLDLGRIITHLAVEILAVGTRGHGGAEDGFDEEGVEGLEGFGVGGAEGVGEFLVGVLEAEDEGAAGEVEASGLEPKRVSGDLIPEIRAGRRWEKGGKGEWGARGRGELSYRTSQRRPSVAVCFLALSSLRQRSWMFSDSPGAASWRSRIFC